MRTEESLNVTFDESLPEPKSSPSVEDDRINEPIVQDLNGSSSLQVNISDKGYLKSIKEARGHPIEQVIGELNEKTLRMVGITIEEYLAMENKKMAKQSMNLSFEKLWYLADEDDEKETYVFDMNEFLAIQIHNNLSSKSVGTHESFYSTLDKNYDAIACDFSLELEFLLASESHTFIDVDLFTCDTPLGTIFDEFSRLSSMEDDLFAYEVGVLEDYYFPCVEQPNDDLENSNLDIYEPRQCYDKNEKIFAEAVDKEINKGVVATWLIRNYRKQFKECMEIKRGLEVDGVNTDVEFDPTNVEFAKWLASKFNNHKTMDRRIYVKGNEIAKKFRIEPDIFLLETPLCKEFKEFNHLFQIHVDVLTRDLPGFKTWKMGFRRNLMMIYVMNAIRFALKVDTLNGPLVTEEKMDILEDIDGERKKRKNRVKMLGAIIYLMMKWFDDHEPMGDDDDDIEDLDDYLIPKDAPYYVDEE
ncbi:hypothetical protein Tco_0144939 [Tanacetum coccineum]